MTNHLSYNIISIIIIIIIILCLMNRDRKYKNIEKFNIKEENNIPIVVLGTDTYGFDNGIIDVGKIIYSDVNI